MLTRVKYEGADVMRLELDEYTLHSPPIPTDRRAYLNGKVENARAQKFEHTSLPDKRTYYAWSRERQQEMEDREWQRRKEGVWFFNNGQPTYLTGNHYFYLNYHRYARDEKPQYRRANLEFFWVWGHCMGHPYCYGLYLHTRRRDGKTSRAASIGLEATSRIKGFKFGIVSKTDVSARDSVFKAEVVTPLKALRDCPWFMPSLKGKVDPENNIEFGEPSTTAKAAQAAPTGLDDLGSSIRWFLPTANAVDSDGLGFLLNDEVAKEQAHDAYQRWMTVKPQFNPSGDIIGKGICATTTDRADDKQDEEGAKKEKSGGTAVKQAIKFWKNSDHTALEEGESTETGLFRLFVPAYKGYKVDEYGNDTAEGREYFQKKRAKLKGVALLNEQRENPFTIEEALMEPVSENCAFNGEHIIQNLAAIEAHENRTGRPLVGRYRLCWADEAAKRPPVRAVPDKDGPWQFPWLPPADELNQVLRIGYVDNQRGERWPKYKPMRTDDTSIGNDPVMRRLSSLKNKSKASNYALIITRPYNEWVERERGKPGYWPSLALIGRYNARPENAEVCFEEGAKACVLFGTEMHCETQTNQNQQVWFEEHGFGEFLADKPALTQTENSGPSSTPGTAASAATTNRHVGLLSQFVTDCVGSEETVNSRGETGINDWGLPYDYRRQPFVEVHQDNLKFDPNNTREYDDTVAEGFAFSHMYRRTRNAWRFGNGVEGEDGRGLDPKMFDPLIFFRR